MLIMHVTGRQTGKSTKLAEIMRKNPHALLITRSYNVSIDWVHRFGINPNRIVSVQALHELRGRLEIHPDGMLLLDDLDTLLPYLLGIPYNMTFVATATGVNL